MKRTATRKGEVERLIRLARRLDEAAFRLARGRPAIDVALGEIFLLLSVGNRLIDLNCSCKADFANEALGLPPQKLYSFSELAAGLRERPLLRQAVIAGEVSPVKARIVMSRALGEDEAPCVAAAMEMTVEGLRKFCGAGEAEPEVAYRMLRYRMSAEQQDRLDAALSLAREMVGYGAQPWKQMEALAREWLGSWKHLGGTEPESEECGADPDWLKEMTRKSDAVSKQLQAVFEAGAVFDFCTGPVSPAGAAFDFCTGSVSPAAETTSPREEIERGSVPTNVPTPLALLAQARRLLQRRKKFDEPLGRVLARISQLELWRWLGYESLGDYCTERLGFSESTAKQRIRLERRLRDLPLLRQALLSGRITYSKALIVARQATPADVAERIAAAAETTWQQVDREAREEEDQADRKASRRKIHGPRAAMRLVEDAVESARQFFASRGEPIDAGEAMARIADHFAARFEVPLKRSDWRTKWQKEVLLRHGGLCAVPGCTRAAEHVHHIVFRSRGGPDAPWNCLGVCKRHHAWAIHRDRLTVRGRGGEYLVWSLRDSELVPYAEFVTLGADDVRRDGAAFDFCTGPVAAAAELTSPREEIERGSVPLRGLTAL